MASEEYMIERRKRIKTERKLTRLRGRFQGMRIPDGVGFYQEMVSQLWNMSEQDLRDWLERASDDSRLRANRVQKATKLRELILASNGGTETRETMDLSEEISVAVPEQVAADDFMDRIRKILAREEPRRPLGEDLNHYLH